MIIRSKRPCLMDSKIFVSEYCDRQCGSCGWNPKVNRERRNTLRRMAAEGRLREWGRDAESKQT